jgi:hypothetical protein
MVASYMASADLGSAGSAAADLSKPAPAPRNCGPMTQQGTMGAHGHEMHPQGFLRLVGCHESGRQKEDAAQRLHA